MVEVCSRLRHVELPFMDKNMRPYFKDVLDHVVRVNETIDGLREVLSFAFEAAHLLESSRQGEVSREFAGWAAILAVPTAIAGIYGMNFEFMPELHWRVRLLHGAGADLRRRRSTVLAASGARAGSDRGPAQPGAAMGASRLGAVPAGPSSTRNAPSRVSRSVPVSIARKRCSCSICAAGQAIIVEASWPSRSRPALASTAPAKRLQPPLPATCPSGRNESVEFDAAVDRSASDGDGAPARADQLRRQCRRARRGGGAGAHQQADREQGARRVALAAPATLS